GESRYIAGMQTGSSSSWSFPSSDGVVSRLGPLGALSITKGTRNQRNLLLTTHYSPLTTSRQRPAPACVAFHFPLGRFIDLPPPSLPVRFAEQTPLQVNAKKTQPVRTRYVGISNETRI